MRERAEEYSTDDDCTYIGESYQVLLHDGAGTIVAVAALSGATIERETLDSGNIFVRCSFDYTVELPPDQAVYTFVLTLTSGSVELDRRVMSPAQVAELEAPSFVDMMSFVA